MAVEYINATTSVTGASGFTLNTTYQPHCYKAIFPGGVRGNPVTIKRVWWRSYHSGAKSLTGTCSIGNGHDSPSISAGVTNASNRSTPPVGDTSNDCLYRLYTFSSGLISIPVNGILYLSFSCTSGEDDHSTFKGNLTYTEAWYYQHGSSGQPITSPNEIPSFVIEYETNQSPSTPTALQVTSIGSDTTPSFSAAVSDPDTTQQIKSRFSIYQNDETTLVGTVDSTLTAGAHTATAEYTSALSLGTYKVRAKTIDDSGAESSNTAFVAFNITTSVTKDLNLLWDQRAPAEKDLDLLWNIAESNQKDLELIWHTLINVDPFTLTLRWGKKTSWQRVTESADTWEKVIH